MVKASLLGQKIKKAKARVGTLRRKEANVEFDVESNEMDDAVSYHHKDREHLQPKPQSPALPKTLERQVSADIPDHSVTHFSSASSSSGEIQFARPISFHTTASKIACKVRKSSEEYGRLNSSYNESKPSMHTDRRMSLQVQQNEEVAKRKMSPQVLQNPGALAIQKKSAKEGIRLSEEWTFFRSQCKC
uniref:Uncharacterized protein n=1 Tax=Ditylenchus dipsaci TaxID=166011 RepID=A0A915EMB4_9BILA